MSNALKRRGTDPDGSHRSARFRGSEAIRSAVETLETRTMLSTVTYTVQGNSDGLPPIVALTGTNAYRANTLRAAINSANNLSSSVVIEFNTAKFTGGGANTITLTSGLTVGATSPTNPQSYEIIGPTANPIVISGAAKYVDFTTTDPLISANIQNLTIAHGNGLGGDGGGIDANGPLTLVGDTFASDITGSGGGVYSAVGPVVVTNCKFISDTAASGGGIFINDTTPGLAAAITGSTFTSDIATTGNGGAIDNFSNASSTTSVTSSTFSGDLAAADGGAVYSYQGESLNITLDTFTSDKSTGGDGGALYSTDGTLTLTGTTFNADRAADDGGAVYFQGTGGTPVLTVTSSSFTNDSSSTEYGGAIYSYMTATATVTSSTFTGDTALESGGAIYSYGGTLLTVNKDNFSGDIANSTSAGPPDTGGGGIFSTDATLNITASTFSNDDATGSSGAGGGVYSEASTLLTITSSTFTGDSSSGSGGGLYFNNTSGAATITSDTFSNNSSSDGGGVYSDSAGLSITGSTFTNDSGSADGGAIYSEDATLTITKSNFSGDTSADGGGGLYASANGMVTVTGSTFTNDATTDDGNGGAIATTAADIEIASDVFSDNSSNNDGGAIYFNGGIIEIEQVTFSDNSALYNGGAIYDDTLARTTNIFDSAFISNSTTLYNGGAINEAGSSAQYANDTFNNNSAAQQGGAIYAIPAGVLTIADSTISGNIAPDSSGGGVYAAGGDVILDGVIVAGNYVPGSLTDYNDLAGSFDGASANNLIGDGSEQNGIAIGVDAGNFVGDDDAPINAELGALNKNGGPTETQIPASTSLAIGNNQDWPVDDTNSNDITSVDQTGLHVRPQHQGFDIGAYQTRGSRAVLLPKVSISTPATVRAPASGTAIVKIPVKLSGSTTSAIVLTYSTIDGTAVAFNGDYTGVTDAMFTIPAGSSGGTYYIVITGVTRETANGPYPKTFQVQLTDVVNATQVGADTVTATLS